MFSIFLTAFSLQGHVFRSVRGERPSSHFNFQRLAPIFFSGVPFSDHESDGCLSRSGTLFQMACWAHFGIALLVAEIALRDFSYLFVASCCITLRIKPFMRNLFAATFPPWTALSKLTRISECLISYSTGIIFPRSFCHFVMLKCSFPIFFIKYFLKCVRLFVPWL